MNQRNEHTTLAGGCFWCLEAVFKEVRGVDSVESGYAGGHVENPSYEEVCRGTTGHAEVVRLAFDPATISFRDLLGIFFSIHDPTTRDRQGADVGPQYRSAIFYETEEQAQLARELIDELQRDGVWTGVVTEVEPLERFWPAEAYHRDYFARNPGQGYCQAVVAPKLAKFRQKFAELRR
jgi:peptide-methionine (S)-S-oxide reductase